jgi:hypothetical protein
MRHLFGAVLVVVCSLAALAQDAPKAEIFAGFSYGNYELIPSSGSSSIAGVTILSGAPSARLGLSGWDGSAAVNMNRWFSFVTDFSGYYSGSSASTTRTETLSCGPSCTQTSMIVNTVANPKIHNFLFGPQFSYPSGKIRPFAHFLVGGEHVDLTSSLNETGSAGSLITFPATVESGHASTTGFAMAFGGGVDYSIKRSLAWRIQTDYLTNQTGGLGQNHVRVSTGLVWRLGE